MDRLYASRTDVRSVRCPACGADPGSLCAGKRSKPRVSNHAERVFAYKAGLNGLEFEQSPRPGPGEGTMSNIDRFNFNGEADVRVVTIDGEPWFVLTDVAKILDYRDAEKAKRHLREGQTNTLNRGIASDLGFQPGRSPLVVNESGLYRLIMRSNVPAAERFQDWVTGEVLPTIRKTGGAYIAPGSQAELDLTNPDTALDKLIEVASLAKQERARRLELEAEAEANAPKIEFADAVKASENSLTFEETAKILNGKHGIDTGRNRLIDTLRKRGVLMPRDGKGVRPYQRYADFFEVAISEALVGGRLRTNYTTYVKASSLPWLVRELGSQAA